MKKLCLTFVISLSLLLISTGMQGQMTLTQLDQLKLGQQFMGTWQNVLNKDTIEVTESQQYGYTFVENVYLVINGKRSFNYINNFCLSPKEGKYKGFVTWSNGSSITWIGIFVTEKKFVVNFVQNFNPETNLGRMELNYETPTTLTLTQYNSDGIKTFESKAKKVK